MSKKDPKNHTVEQLLKVLNEKPQKKLKEYEKNSDVREFLLQNGIESGTTIYERDFMYKWYLSWTNKREPLTQGQFQKEMKKRIRHMRSWFYLNEDGFKERKRKFMKRIVKDVFKEARKAKKEKEEKRSPQHEPPDQT